MTAAMGPPPPRNPAAPASSISEHSKTNAMGPPPPRIPNTSQPEPGPSSSETHLDEPKLNPPQTDAPDDSNPISSPSDDSVDATSVGVERKQEQRKNNMAVPYSIPEWSDAPCHQFFLEVLKEGAIIDQLDVNKKGAYMFGRVDLCDFVLEHPTISRFHAVLQFKSNGEGYIYDLGSTHGTFINKSQVKKKVYVDLHVGDVIRFGQSSRLYIFQGPSDLMPPEADLKKVKNARIRQEMQDMEASLLRAKVEASRADGISWGMREDAVEETEDDMDEITWQTYKGQLTEKQEKTRDKVIKRLEKIAHMKKEIDAIRAKDIAQGGLTQGQQTQIARNEQRISQIMEELENLEETLNESIRESLGARTGRLSRGKKKRGMEDEEEEDYSSNDDEFYDRTLKFKKQKSTENKSIETADSLLDKKDAITQEIEEKEQLLVDEGMPKEANEVIETGDDALDAYMTAVSSQLVSDNKEKIRNELSALQVELDRILYLLRIADPTGDAARKRASKEHMPKIAVKKNLSSDTCSHPSAEKNQESAVSSEKSQRFVPEGSLTTEKFAGEATSQSVEKHGELDSVTDATEGAATVYTVAKPQWLGAVDDRKKKKIAQEDPVHIPDTDEFVDYKDRGKILKLEDSSQGEPGIENAAPGLIIRKKKQVEKSKVVEVKDSEQSTGSELKAEDAVALLLKHSRGYQESDEEERPLPQNQGKKEKKKPKRVLGPERPSFLDEEPVYASWVPPEGQSGDGRTSLNDRFGY